MIEAHTPTPRHGHMAPVNAGGAPAGGVAQSFTLGLGAGIFGAGKLPTALLLRAACGR